jgi:hypothetical protein
MEIILAAYEKKTVNFSGGYFTVLSVNGEVELSAKGIEDIPIETGDQINLGNVAKFVLQNITGSGVILKYTTASTIVNKKAQVTKAEIINSAPINVQFDEAFTIGAVGQQGNWSVGQSGNWSVGQSGDWSVGQSGNWSVGQSGDWSVGVLSATTNMHKARVECLAGQATKLFSVGTRKSNRINIRGDQLNGVSLGGDNTVNDNSGGFLDVGMVDYMDTSGELWAFNNGSSSVFVDVLELV